MKYIHDKIREKCEFCNKTFSEISVVKKHVERVHRKIKKHKCNSCDKSFYDSKDMKEHFSRLHDSRIHECEICGNTYNSVKTLKYHQKLSHQKKDIRSKSKCHLCGGIYLGLKSHIKIRTKDEVFLL